MKYKGTGRKGKRKIKIKRGELVGFIVLALFLALIIYLIIPTQIPKLEKPQLEVNTSTVSSLPEDVKPTLKTAIVDQLGENYPNPEFINTVERMMRQAGLELDVYEPNKVTVNLYASLAAYEYNIIVFRVHAGASEEMKGRPVGLFTTEPYSKLEYSQEQLFDLVGAGQPYNSSEVVFAVTPKFIKERTIMDYQGTCIILMGCLGLYSQELPQAFIDKGASVIIGWTGLVDVNHTDETTLSLLRMMLLERMSISDAVRAAIEEVGTDPDCDSVLGYYPLEGGSLTLSDLSKIKIEINQINSHSIKIVTIRL